MRKQTIQQAGALLALLAGAAGAQEPTVRFAVEPAEARPGERVAVQATVEVPDGYYIYATDDTTGMPTTLTVGEAPGLSPRGGVREPEPKLKDVDVGLEEPVEARTHAGTVTFARTLRLAPDAEPGPRTIPVEVRYLLCDARGCTPGDAAGEVALEVLPAPAGADDGGVAGGIPGLPGLGGETGGTPEVTVAARLVDEDGSVRPGGTVEVQFDVTIEEGWHIYTSDTSERWLPTAIALDPPATAEGALVGLAASELHDTGVGQAPVYRGQVTLSQEVRVAPDAPRGELDVSGVLSWQVCDDADTACYDDEAEFSVRVEVAGEPIERTGGDRGATAGAGEADGEEGGVLGLAWAAVVLGILMLLQPCTYPMIPITVSIFSKGKELSRPRAVGRAGVYAVGIIVSFVLIAGIVWAVFGSQGQGTLSGLATHPWVNLVIGALFVYFAFSFFGYYELGLPAPLMRLMQAGSATRGGDGAVPAWSLFLMGFFFVLTSYTCGAPVVLALFATAASDPHPLAVIFATFVFACTVAAPYFVLSLIPGAVRQLPKSGSWFSVFKATLGFLELAFAFKFLRAADVGWGFDLLGREAILGLWAAIGLLTALYLLGYLPLSFPHDPKLRPPTKRRAAWAAVFLGLAGYCGYGAAGGRLWEDLETFLLIEGDVESGLQELSPGELAERAGIELAQARAIKAAAAQGEPLHTAEELMALGLDEEDAWRTLGAIPRRIRFGPAPDEGEPDDRLTYRLDQRALAEARARTAETGRPAFLMFTGHQCTNCQLMENTVMQDERVEELLRPLDRIALFTDSGDPLEDRHKALMEDEYGNAVLPAFYVIDAEGEPLATQIGGTGRGEEGVERFLEFLRTGLARTRAEAAK